MPMFRGFGQNTAYKIDRIDRVELDQTYQRELQQLSRAASAVPSTRRRRQDGRVNQILSKVVTDAMIAEAAPPVR